MIVWRGAGGLAFGYAALAMILFAGVASQFVDESLLPFTIGIGLSLAAVATWFTGIAVNQTKPRLRIAEWSLDRQDQISELVESGQFSLGPGMPQPTSVDEARDMGEALYQQELKEAFGALNRHTLFWIPMQYFAFVWGAIAVLVVVLGLIG